MSNEFKKDRTGGTGTKEWSEHSFNLGKGCSNNCLYCYARANALRFNLIENPSDWEKESINENYIKRIPNKKEGVIMFPTTHDITPFYLEASVIALKKMLAKGNKVLIVSKPYLSCISRLCEELKEYKDQILFRFTIGSMIEERCKLWEPGATSPQERLASLKYAFEHGFQTSVSQEPMLGSVEETIDVVKAVEPFVTDKIWIGKMNKIDARVVPVSANVVVAADIVKKRQEDKFILSLYNQLKDNPKVEWKDSIKQVIEK